MPINTDQVDDHPYDDLDEFINALRPRGPLWNNDATGWVFRGQANSEWQLRARAVRDPKAFEAFGLSGLSTDWSTRSDLQIKLLSAFRDGLNRAGLVIPMRAPRTVVDNEISHPGAEPPKEAFPLMALAQHHGLPTMLLDWTRRGWVAAYFAAEEAADPKRRPDTERLAVWAIRRSSFAGDWQRIFYDAPGGTNPNLAAQAGLFTLHHDDDSPSLEAYLARNRGSASLPVPKRLTLPCSCAPKLLRLLAYEGVTGASLFPGPDGVVRAMREYAYWDKRV